ncbi:MAG: T9SS type A sorting domain-containing protein [Melioribacteraceae bacterium]|nr:T9SS type A sorting domain-containing protein [Melioribacteraceae bacterium]
MKRIILTIGLLISLNVNAQTWKSFTTDNSNLPDNMVRSIAIGSDNAVWFATESGLASFKNNVWEVYTTENGLSSNKINYVSFLPFNSDSLWIGTDNGAAILTTDSDDISYTRFINRENDEIISDTVTAAELDGLSGNWIGTDKGLSVITESGIYNFTEENGLENGEVSSLKTLPDNWVHVGTAGGGVSRLKYNGVDAVTSASRIITTWSGLASDSVLTIYVTDDTLRWYGTTQGVSTHHGENTKDINNWWIYNTYTSDIIDNYVRAIVRDKNGNMWFGTKKGLSKLSSDKSTWQSYTEDDGLVGNNVFDIKVDMHNNLWIATDEGVSMFSESATSVNSNEVEDYKIRLTNYPNPFNPSTTIEYIVSNSLQSRFSNLGLVAVELIVFDILGHKVETLVNSQHLPGIYRISWNAVGQSSGIYFCKLKAGDYTLIRKMLVLK